jgi:hypothetical protein
MSRPRYTNFRSATFTPTGCGPVDLGNPISVQVGDYTWWRPWQPDFDRWPWMRGITVEIHEKECLVVVSLDGSETRAEIKVKQAVTVDDLREVIRKSVENMRACD